MHRVPRLAVALPHVLWGEMVRAADEWWDGFLWMWGAFFDRDEQARWKASQRDDRDADLIDRGATGGYAAGCGSDES